MSFKDLIQEQLRLLKEQDPADPTNVGAAATTPNPPVSSDIGTPGQPSQPEAAPQEPKQFDKPYADLGKLLYKSLRMNYDEIPDGLKNKILAITPQGDKSIETDEQGSNLFKVVEEIIQDADGVQPAETA